jgi:hypothetical protein
MTLVIDPQFEWVDKQEAGQPAKGEFVLDMHVGIPRRSSGLIDLVSSPGCRFQARINRSYRGYRIACRQYLPSCIKGFLYSVGSHILTDSFIQQPIG